MKNFNIPCLIKARYVVYDMVGPLRWFPTREEAENFVSGDKSFVIKRVPSPPKIIKVEDAPF